MKVSEISDDESVYHLTKKIKEAFKKKFKKSIRHLALVLEDGTMYDHSDPDMPKTKLYSLGINRYSRLRYYD